MQLLKQLLLLAEAQWTGSVATKKHPPEGLFATGSAEAITKWAKESHGNLKDAMASLSFYVTRGGSNLSTAAKAKVEDAKAKLRSMFKE